MCQKLHFADLKAKGPSLYSSDDVFFLWSFNHADLKQHYVEFGIFL